jgi:hypothetical protein
VLRLGSLGHGPQCSTPVAVSCGADVLGHQDDEAVTLDGGGLTGARFEPVVLVRLAVAFFALGTLGGQLGPSPVDVGVGGCRAGASALPSS